MRFTIKLKLGPSSASEEMSATSEGPAAQAEQLRSSIALFRTDQKPAAQPPTTVKGPPATAVGLSVGADEHDHKIVHY